MNEFYTKEQEEYNKVSKKGEMVTANKPIAKPNVPDLSKIKPTYSSKATKK